MCFRYRKLLIPYSEGGLNADAAAKVERHVAGCSRCAAELEMIRCVVRVLDTADMPAREPAHDLWAKVSARISDEAVRPAPSARVGIAAGVAAAVLVGVIGIKLLAPNAEPVVTPVATRQERVATAVAKSDKAKEPALSPQPKHEVKSQPGPELPARKPGISPDSHRYYASYHDSPSVLRRIEPATPVDVATAPSRSIRPSDEKSVSDYSAGRVALSWIPTAPAAGLRGEAKDKHINGVMFVASSRVSDGWEADTPLRLASYFEDDVRVSGRYGNTTTAAPAMEIAPAVPAAGSTILDAVIFADAGRTADDYSSAHAATVSVSSTSVVDDLNETEGIRTAAIFTY